MKIIYPNYFAFWICSKYFFSGKKKNQNEVLPEFSYTYIPKYRGETVRAHGHALDIVTLLKEMMMANINRYLIRCQLLFKSSICIF